MFNFHTPRALLTAALIYSIISELSLDESDSDSEDELLFYSISYNWSGVTSFDFFLSKIVHLSFSQPSYLISFGGIFP